MTGADYTTVPPGEYHVRVATVSEAWSRDGSPRIGLQLRVASGDHAGRLAAWDNLVLSPRGTPRARRVCEVLGVTMPADLSTFDAQTLLDREAFVTIRVVELPAPDGGVVRRNEVPYGGWRRFVP